MEIPVLPARCRGLKGLACPQSCDSTAACSLGCNMPTGQHAQGRKAKKDEVAYSMQIPAEVQLQHQPIQPCCAVTRRSAKCSRPSTAPCSRTPWLSSPSTPCVRGTSKGHQRALEIAVYQCRPGTQHRLRNHAGLGPPTAVGAATFAVVQGTQRALQAAAQSTQPSRVTVMGLDTSHNRTVHSAAAAAEAGPLPEPSLLLGLQCHNSAFMRAWHSRIIESIKQQRTSAVSSASCVAGETTNIRRGACLTSRCSRSTPSRPSVRTADRLPNCQQLQHGWPGHAGPNSDWATLSETGQSRTRGSSMSLSVAAAMIPRQHAVATGCSTAAASSALNAGAHDNARVRGGRGSSLITAAAQQWLEEHSTSRQQYHEQHTHQTAVAEGVSSGRPQMTVLPGLVAADGFGLENDWQMPGPDLSQECRSGALPDPEVLQVMASDLLDRCTVQNSKKVVEVCSICLDDITVNELAPMLLCGHRMHRMCLVKWLSQRLVRQVLGSGKAEAICPICKQISVDRQQLAMVEPAAS